MIFQAGDSDEGRDFAAASADAIFSRHWSLEAGQAFYADVKGRLSKFGRSRGELLILPAATFVLGDTDAEAAEIARDVRRAQVSPQTALGFDGFGVGERHERPFVSSSPTVVLSHVAARTTHIRLFTTVTTLSLLDPVRAFEDYATLDHLSGGRLELIIGKGNGAAQRELFHVTPEDQWDRNAESYEVFRRLWRGNKITYETKFRPPLTEAEVWPRPLQRPIRVWHGSATSKGVGRPGRQVRRPAVLGQRHQPDRALRGN